MDRPAQDFELYTIPSYSSWFSWNNIHEVERFSLREFFDGTSITRSPRIYKEYRDFIISKYREDPSRKLTFTEVRKSLVGDISVLLKVFTFLEKWGLINFNVSDDNSEENGYGGGGVRRGEDEDENWRSRVKVEEGAPYGVRVVAAPNSVKPLVAPPPPPVSVVVDGGGVVGEVGESGFKWPPLASYSDVYGELMQQELKKGLVCGSCKENCESVHYEYAKEGGFILCEKCFKAGNYEDKSIDDFKLKDNLNEETSWTETETLLLLESVLKHGDDWDIVVKNVQTKSKLECISKLIQLPLGDLMFGAANKKGKYLDAISESKALASNESKESSKLEDHCPEVKAKEQGLEIKENNQQNGDTEDEGPPLKRVCTGPPPDTGDSLMKQVARIASMLGPHVTASAADAAITALCYENQCSRDIFDDDDDYNNSKSSPKLDEEGRAVEGADSVQDKKPNESEIQGISLAKSIIPVNLRTRAATATALGAAAANAKLLADQEEREIGHLIATMIETQLGKLKRKMKYIEDLEAIMEKEQDQVEQLEESLVLDRINVLQRVFAASVNKPKDHAATKHQTDIVN